MTSHTREGKGLTAAEFIALRHIAERGVDRATGRVQSVEIHRISEAFRRKAIDLAMMEPPLIEVDGPRLLVTDAGRLALIELGYLPKDVLGMAHDPAVDIRERIAIGTLRSPSP